MRVLLPPLVLVASLAFAGPPAKTSLASTIDLKAERFVLDNGLTLIVHEDHKAPIVAVNVWYHVGAKDEAPGRSGFAHLFEHLMFNGSENFNTDYFKALGAMGATDLNGTTNRDRTNYFQNVPVSGLDKLLFLESDRMGHLLGVVDKARLDEQRGVVQNEKRQSENQPYGQVFNEANKVLFPPHHPYAYPRGTVLGSMEDLDAASLKDVQDWFKAWYGPNNATLVIAGDIDAKTALEKVKQYFGHIPAGPPVIKRGPWAEKLAVTVRKELEDRVPQTRLYRFWVTPAVTDPANDHLQMATAVLAGGKTSRLFKRLVYTDQIATDVSAGVWEGELAGQGILMASVKPGVELAKVERAIDEELAKFLKDGPTPDELARLRTQFVAGFIRGLERIGGFGGKSDVLAESTVFLGSPDAWKDSLARLEQATPKDVLAASKEWLGAPRLDLVVKPFGTFTNATPDVDRKKLPALGPPPAITFPALQRATLKNGLKVVLAERRGVPVVDLRLRIDVGTSSDSSATAGLGSLAMDLLDEGAGKRSAIEIGEELQRLGATLGTGAGLDVSSVSMTALKVNLEPSLKLLSEVVLQPTFPANDFERLKNQRLAGIKQEKNSPSGVAQRLAPKLFFGDGHPYALPLSGSGFEATVAKLTRDDAVAWAKAALKPGSSTLGVVGDISMAELLPKLEQAFGGWAAGEAKRATVAEVPLRAKPVVWLVDRPGSQQSVILVGHPAPPTNNPDEVAIEGFNVVLGGDFNSRLNMNLREDKHWSYGVRTFFEAARGQRLFAVHAPVQTDKTKESLFEIRKEVAELLGKRPTTPEEYERIQADRVLKLPGRWETMAAVQGALGQVVVYGLADDYFQTYPDKVRALKREQYDEAAKKVLKPQALVWVIVGDRSKIEKGVRELDLGEVTVVDTDGNAVK
ncbi:MAG: insulinase family protein [Myxococcaceae bacterium]|nr:insulinase family protein [Myxococcaceae bacterium]